MSALFKTLFYVFLILLPWPLLAQSLQAQCVNGRRNALSEFADFGCDFQTMAHECQDWFYKNPETLGFAKNCRKNEAATAPPWYETCQEAWGESWKEMWDLVNTTPKAIEACDGNMECKQELSRQAFFACQNKDGSPQYPCVDQKQLSEVYAGDLMRKRDKVRTLALQDRAYRADILKKGVPLPEDRPGVKIPLSALKQMVEDQFTELGVKASCYNSAGYAHMACYAVASIVDPTMVAGAAAAPLKGGKWVAKVLSKTKEFSAAVAKSEIKNLGKKTAEVTVKNAEDLLPSTNSLQTKIWQAREAGRTDEAAAMQKKLTVDLENSPIKSWKFAGEGVTGAYYVELADGSKGVWKRDSLGAADGNAEIAAYKVDQHLGLNMVPVTVRKEFDGKPGTFQYFAEGKQAKIDDPENFIFYDYLILNSDRHAGNYLIENGRPIAIDHGLAFKNGGVVDFPRHVDQIISVQQQKDAAVKSLRNEVRRAKQGGVSPRGLSKLEQKLASLEAETNLAKKKASQEITALGIKPEATIKLAETTDAEWKVILKDLTDYDRKEFLKRRDKSLEAIKKAHAYFGDGIFPVGRTSPLIRKPTPLKEAPLKFLDTL